MRPRGKRFILSFSIALVVMTMLLCVDLICELYFEKHYKSWEGKKVEEVTSVYWIAETTKPRSRERSFRRNRLFYPLWRMLTLDNYYGVYVKVDDGKIKKILGVCRFPQMVFIYPR